MTKRPAHSSRERDEPEPIEAEFEPAAGAEPRRARRPSRSNGPRPLRSRAATLPELLIAGLVSAAIGAMIAIAVTNTSSGAPTGTLAREIDNLNRGQADLTARAEQAATDGVNLRARLDAQGERLDQQNASDMSLRAELAELTNQLSAVSGASGPADATASTGASAAASPLGILLTRIKRLENIVQDDKTAPQTTRDLQRAMADLSAQVTTLDAANTTLVAAFDRREAALAALESGMTSMASDITALRSGRPAAPGKPVAETAPSPEAPVLAATARSQAIRALSMLETAAQRDQPFERERQALAEFLPGETGLAAMSAPAHQGVPTLVQLRHAFDGAAGNAARISTEESDDGWNWLRQSFGGVVDFEPAPIVAANAEIIRNARRQLDIGDLRGAVAAISGVSGGAAGAFTGWTRDAQARFTLDEGLRDLNARLLGTTASAGSPG